MSKIQAFIKDHPILSYYVLVFVISWGGMLLFIVRPYGIPATPEEANRLILPALLILFAGPSFSGLLMTGLVHGRAGYRDLGARLCKFRVGAIWYAVALLFAPLMVGAVVFFLSLSNRSFLPGVVQTADKAILMIMGVSSGLIGGGLLEELGWTGFANPALRRRFSVLTTGLLMGILWGAWHLLITYWNLGTPSGSLNVAAFLPALIFDMLNLPAYRILLVRLYDRTGSLPVIMLMHAAYSASRVILNPPGLSLAQGLIYESISVIVLWVIVAAVVMLAKDGHGVELEKAKTL